MSSRDRHIPAEPEFGWVASEVADEFPDLHLLSVRTRSQLDERSHTEAKNHLRELSNRWSGARAINLRREAVPAAYRIFFRHIGLDPDLTRTPIEQAIFERMMDGGFLPSSPLKDVLTIALVETSVPVWAVAAQVVDGPLGIRLSQHGESLATGEGGVLEEGALVVADAAGVLASLFGEISGRYEPQGTTEELLLFTIQVAGVSLMHAEEALWLCTSAINGKPVR